jgi:F420H(2)-dependent quinone reductase
LVWEVAVSVEQRAGTPRVPPRWFIRLAWYVHRSVYRASGGRIGLWRPRANGWGTLRLTVTGRRTGRQRSVIIGYLEDGPNLVTLAMNGWGEGEPAWWLNLQAHPEVIVDLVDGRRLVRGHAATGDERLRLWDRWRAIDTNLDAYAALRTSETAVVVLEPRPGESHTSGGDRLTA